MLADGHGGTICTRKEWSCDQTRICSFYLPNRCTALLLQHKFYRLQWQEHVILQQSFFRLLKWPCHFLNIPGSTGWRGWWAKKQSAGLFSLPLNCYDRRGNLCCSTFWRCIARCWFCPAFARQSLFQCPFNVKMHMYHKAKPEPWRLTCSLSAGSAESEPCWQFQVYFTQKSLWMPRMRKFITGYNPR